MAFPQHEDLHQSDRKPRAAEPTAGVLRLEPPTSGSSREGDHLLGRPADLVNLNPVLADVLGGMTVETGADEGRV